MRRKRTLKRICRVVVYALFLLLLGEFGARAFWFVRGAGFLTAHRGVYRSFYPNVSQLQQQWSGEAEGCFHILMLGGSVLHTDFGNIEHLLREKLTRATGKAIRIYNLSAAAHTSLDSYYKYRHLADWHFDLVMVYHGINEVRANNCPASVFQSDYSHLSWYRLINDWEKRTDSRWLVFPYTIKFVAFKLADRLGLSSGLPTHRPDPESLDDGCDVKTADSVRRSLQGILELAADRVDPVLLMTFSYHVPDNYTEEAFRDRALDYTVHRFPIELWGKPSCVAAGIAAHNAVTVDLTRQFHQVLFVDQEKLIPKEGRYFNDICHLTHEGCARFVDNALKRILPLAQVTGRRIDDTHRAHVQGLEGSAGFVHRRAH